MRDNRIAIQMQFEETPRGTDEQYEAFLDSVQEHLDAIRPDVQIAASLAERTVEFATTVTASTFEAAVNELLADVRTALHAAGCHTDGWPQYTPSGRNVRELQDA